MELDDFLPQYHFNEVHSIVVEATPETIFRAIKELPPTELSPLVHLLFSIRSLPARLTGKSGLDIAQPKPLLEQMWESGFTLLQESPNKEIVFGAIGQFWKLSPDNTVRLADGQDFVAFERPDYAKVAANFCLSNEEDVGRFRVSTESRIYVADPRTRQKFARYWFVIYPGSAFIRRILLKAIKRRAERYTARQG